MLEELKRHLRECGLSPKEADVYLAMLELGASPVQEIAEKADVNRSTTYLAIEGLKRRGLASSYEEDKRMLFVAEDPHRLLSALTDELAHVAARRDRLQMTLPALLAIFNAIERKPKVRFFEGEEALRSIRQEIADIREPLWEVYAVDEPLVVVANAQAEERIQFTKRLQGRMLMAIKPGCVPPYFDPRGIEARVMDYERCPFSGDIALTSEKMYVVNAQEGLVGIAIESREIVQIFRAFYEAAWQGARPWTPPVNWKPSGV